MDRLKVLLIEDEIYLADDIKKNLESAGHSVISVNSEELSELNNDLILKSEIGIIDVVLKGNMEGIKVAEKILAKNKIPIILIGNHCDDDVLEDAKKIHPFAFLIKPFGNEELITTLHLAKKTFPKQNKAIESPKINIQNPLINQKKILDSINKKIDNITKEELFKNVNNNIPDLKYIKINFNDLFNENQILLIIVDKEGKIKFSNEAFSNLLGMEKEEVIEQNLFDYIHKDDLPKLKNLFDEEYKKGITKKIDVHLSTEYNRKIKLEATIEYLVNGDNQNYFSITALNAEDLKFLKSIFHNIKNHFGRDNRYSIDEIKKINLTLKVLNNAFKNISVKNGYTYKAQRNMYSLIEFSELLLSEIDDMSAEEVSKMSHGL